MYAWTLYAHSYTRWAVVVTVVVLTTRAALGWRLDRPWSHADELSHKAMMIAVDWQFTLGVIMYLFLSPFSHAFFNNVGLGYGEPALRFFGLEHPLAMLTAVSLVHLGRERSERLKGRADLARGTGLSRTTISSPLLRKAISRNRLAIVSKE